MPRKVWDFAVFVIACYAGYAAGLAVGQAQLTPYLGNHPLLLWVLGGLMVALPVIWTGRALAKLTELDLAGHTSILVRRPVGWIWRTLTLAAPIGTFLLVLGIVPHFLPAADVNGLLAGHLTTVSAAVVAVCYSTPFLYGGTIHAWAKHRLGRLIAPFRRILRSHQVGNGGSSTIGGLFEEWRLAYKTGAILLGASIYDPRWKVGIIDDRHGLTIATNGGGKGRAALIPNLLSWPHSVLVIDPKGTNCAVTAARRGKGGYRVKNGMGQRVYVLNPFKINANLPWMPPPSRFNPLSILDPNSSTFYEDLDLIADALVIPSSSETFFDFSARSLLRALIAFAIFKYGKKATLNHVREMLGLVMVENSPVIQGMVDCGGLVAAAAAQIANAEDRLKSGIVATAIQQTEWLVSKDMQDALSDSDFSIFDLKEKPTTIYLVIPPEYLETHARFLRLFVNLSIKAASMGGRSKTPILFLLDEFYSLGPMPSMAKAIGNLRSYNIRIWPILQNLSQLVELYPSNWETFIANTGFMQIFSINDSVTAKYMTEKLGRTIIYGQDNQGNKVPAGAVDLRDAVEITQEASRISGKQIVFREGEDSLVLRRLNFDEAFKKNAYNPDPDHKGS